MCSGHITGGARIGGELDHRFNWIADNVTLPRGEEMRDKSAGSPECNGLGRGRRGVHVPEPRPSGGSRPCLAHPHNRFFLPIFCRLPKAFSSMVVRPPAMLPFGGLTAGKIVGLVAIDHLLIFIECRHEIAPPLRQWPARSLQTISAPVISLVSPKLQVPPIFNQFIQGITHEWGWKPGRWVVSLSPHLTLTQISLRSHSSRLSSLAQCMYSLAFQLAVSHNLDFTVASFDAESRSRVCRFWRCLRQFGWSTRARCQCTTTAATLGLAPVPINVRKKQF